MVSAILILVAAVSSLLLVWTILHTGLPNIRSLEDWEKKKYEIDIKTFQILVDPAEERYLRTSLPPVQFRSFQRRRIRLAQHTLELIGTNAAMLMKLGQLAKTGPNPTLVRDADELVVAALRLRCNLLLIQPCLWIKWLFPQWSLSIPACEWRYQELQRYLTRVRQSCREPLTAA
jgi:hypothetical protein